MSAEALQIRPDISKQLLRRREGEVIQGEYKGPSIAVMNGGLLWFPLFVNAPDKEAGVSKSVEMPRTVDEWKIDHTINLRYDFTREKFRLMLGIIGGSAQNMDHNVIAEAIGKDAPLSALYYAMGNEEERRGNKDNEITRTTALFIVQKKQILKPHSDGRVDIRVKIIDKGTTSLTLEHEGTQNGEAVSNGGSVISFQRFPYVAKPKKDRQAEDYSKYVACGGPVTASKEEVEAFANDISGDVNQAHRDEIYAAKTVFGEPIVHGLITLGKVLVLLADDARKMGEKGTLKGYEVNFRNAAFFDETIVTKKVKRPVNGSYAYDFVSTKVSGEPIMVGTATFA